MAKRKSRSSTPKRQPTPLKRMENARSAMIKKLKQSISADDRSAVQDVERGISLVRAILTINNEIWDRCKDSMDFFVLGRCAPTANFRQLDFKSILAKGSGSVVLFSTTEIVKRKLFSLTLLCSCPGNLAILPVQHLPNPAGFKDRYGNGNDSKIFVDYEALFESSLILHEEVLVPFLVALKKHLESIQVLLGEIDEFLMEHNAIVRFIETSFDVSLQELKPEPYTSTIQLKSCQDTSSCEIDFGISKESERARLVKFLDFVSTPSDP